MSKQLRVVPAIIRLGVLALVVAGCGDPGQSGTDLPEQAGAGAGCPPVAGTQLVVLADDRGLQLVENVVPAVNADASGVELLGALDQVSTRLDTAHLIALNRAVGVDRKTPRVAAEEFAVAEGLSDGIASGPGGAVVVGAANFPESEILAELYRIALTTAGFEVRVQTIGNRELYATELQQGRIQVVPEYVGTLTEFLNAQVHGADPEPLASSELEPTMTALRDLGEEVGLVFGQPAAAANQNAFAVTREFADTNQVSTLSELAERCSGAETLLGGPPECPQRPFCLPGLTEVYGLRVGPFSSYDSGGPLTKEALRRGEISVGLVFSTDGDLARA